MLPGAVRGHGDRGHEAPIFLKTLRAVPLGTARVPPERKRLPQRPHVDRFLRLLRPRGSHVLPNGWLIPSRSVFRMDPQMELLPVSGHAQAQTMRPIPEPERPWEGRHVRRYAL